MLKEDILSEQILREQIHTTWAGSNIQYLDVVDSTNEEAKRISYNGAGHGTLVVADCQTEGKGRRGRFFDSPKQAGVWMSLIIKDEIAPEKASMLTLVMGLAAVRGIELTTGLKPLIKWPNDVILGGKKLCGILTEMSLQEDRIHHIVIGVGINVGNQSFPEEIQSVATSILLEMKGAVSRSELIANVLSQFERYYQVFMKTQDLRELMEPYNQYLINLGKQVKVLNPKGEYTGCAVGINQEGELLVETDGQICRVSSGEVSVRGVLGYV